MIWIYIPIKRVGFDGDPLFAPNLPLINNLIKISSTRGCKICIKLDIITNTHLHGNHCWANEAFKKLSGAKIFSHRQQGKFYDITVINENTSRVDLPGGSADELKQSIKELSQLKVEYLLPGHMDIITRAGDKGK